MNRSLFIINQDKKKREKKKENKNKNKKGIIIYNLPLLIKTIYSLFKLILVKHQINQQNNS